MKHCCKCQLPDTRERLLQAGLQAFGRRDYDGVSIRQVAEAAGANIAAISYHFGGKRELYHATVAYLAERLHANLGDRLQAVKQAIREGNPQVCEEQLCLFLGRFLEQILSSELGDNAPGIIFREQHQPSEAFDILYTKLLEPVHKILTSLVALRRGWPPDDRRALTLTQALIGQTVIFRVGRTTLLRRLDQTEYSAADIEQLKAQLTEHCRLLLGAAPINSRTDKTP